MFGDIPGFIALNTSDKVPNQVEIVQSGLFLQRFLDEIFTKIPYPESRQFTNRRYRLCLASADETDIVWRSTRPAGSVVNRR